MISNRNAGNAGNAAPIDHSDAFCRDNHVALAPLVDDGPLAGTRFAVKDVFAVAGSRTGFGQPDWLRTHPPAQTTAALIDRLLGAGARLIGRTISDELAYSLTGANHHYGTPLNSRDPARLPGGSSSGSASAVAALLCDFAIGTDCGGSIRVPASYCGLFGMRPSHGRLSLEGCLPFAPSFDVAGWFARDAGLFADIGSVLLDDRAAAATRASSVIFLEDAFRMLDAQARLSLDGARSSIGDHFSSTSSLSIGQERLSEWRGIFQTIQAFEIWSNHGDWVRAERPALGPGVRERFERASTITKAKADAARDAQLGVRMLISSHLRDGAVLCMPTVPFVAPLKLTLGDEIETEVRNRAMSLLCIAGLCGLPQVSLPIGCSGSLPIGLSLIGTWGSDEVLLETAAALAARFDALDGDRHARAAR